MHVYFVRQRAFVNFKLDVCMNARLLCTAACIPKLQIRRMHDCTISLHDSVLSPVLLEVKCKQPSDSSNDRHQEVGVCVLDLSRGRVDEVQDGGDADCDVGVRALHKVVLTDTRQQVQY